MHAQKRKKERKKKKGKKNSSKNAKRGEKKVIVGFHQFSDAFLNGEIDEEIYIYIDRGQVYAKS